jgi:DNA invertase Pin-like site-specific DNA recombinase
LNNSQVRFIRQMALNGHPQREIAKAFGVGKSTVGHIISNRTWNHLI